MRSVLDRLDREDVRLHQPRYLTLPLSVYDELLALVLQMIVSPTLNSLSQDLDLVERRFECKATWGRGRRPLSFLSPFPFLLPPSSRWNPTRTWSPSRTPLS